MSEILLLRHTEPVSSGLYIGRGSDPGLSPRGKAGAEAIAAILGTGEDVPGVIYSSPLRRALETVQPLARGLKLRIHEMKGLAEIDFGEWEGLSWREIAERDPEDWRSWLDDPWKVSPPGGETLAELQSRVVGDLEKLLHDNPGKRILVASHGGPLRSVLGYALGLAPSAFWSVGIDYGSLCRFQRKNPGTLDLLQWNVSLGPPPETGVSSES